METMPTRLDAAFRAVARRNFLPAAKQEFADIDMPLAIGYGQTNSQPSTVRRMLEWLDVQPGQDVLDVGSGSGWTTALLAHLVGPAGRVYAVELIPELREFGEANCHTTGVTNAFFYAAEDVFGLPEKAPFDRILVSASTDTLPLELIDQLKPGGKLVIPIRSGITVITKLADGTLEVQAYPGFSFVPLRRTASN